MFGGVSVVASTAVSSASASHVIRWAEQPQATPNYIFPFEPLQYFSNTNLSQFQFYMYRPLYWFGNGAQPTLDLAESIANNPTYSNGSKTVSFTLKKYKWSNGETVTAQDVLFWMNMLKVEKTNWAAYAPGTAPDDITTITTSGNRVTINLTGPVNKYWFTYNILSQITPMPMAWDVTALGQKAGSQSCGTASYQAVTVSSKGDPLSAAAKSCVNVFTFLSEQAGFNPTNPKATINALPTYATNKLWQVVDGPFHLATFDSSGYVVLDRNSKYSGPATGNITQLVELPYTSSAAEFSALLGGKVDFGYLPSEDITSPTKNAIVAGKNNPRLAAKFNLVDAPNWAVSYFPYNFNSVGDNGQAGKIFKQLYFRQAFQSLMDQKLFISKIYKGYAYGTYGPVPIQPANPFVTNYERANPYPYNPKTAVNILSQHGWRVEPGGVSLCENAKLCGVPVGTPLKFTVLYAGGITSLTEQMTAFASAVEAAGIHLTLTTGSFGAVLGASTPCSGSSCTWELANWGAGWIYAPDYYPTGEEIFKTGAGSNSGSYSDPRNDALINATNFTNTSIATWENYFTKMLPVVWQPTTINPIYEVAKTVSGYSPLTPTGNITPEDWSIK